jgi:leader peptidase (prepilin peptidase)/N-methyltransferase
MMEQQMLNFLFFLLLLIIFMTGAAVFSFLGVIADRLPKGEDFVKGRSKCSSCGRELSWYQMIPVFSYIFLGGKCSSCKSKIPLSCLILELSGGTTAVLTMLSYIKPDQYSQIQLYKWLLAFAFISVMTVITLLDAETMEIPNGAIIAIAILGILSIFVFNDISLLDRGIGIICISIPMLLLSLAIEGAFGGGDMKLMAATGLILGWKLNLLGFFIAVVTGGIYAAILLLTKKKGKKDHFAFGPFLCVGSAVSLLFGTELITWYLGLFNI